ncbi:DNA topoisomerase IB [Nonomuraea spiralis]|uniref:DNA topoisomerase IB n=1 Tax=Nonomuraea spiralis TaxID=46182 RepID=UPI0037B7A007
MPELHPSDQSEPGIVRRRRGRGFGYEGPDGRPVRDSTTLRRIRSLVIPPAWKDVWICPSPHGHLQAVGTDAAGRRQYRYRVLAAAARLLDVGFFRVGGESYDTYGLATLRMEHVTCRNGTVTCSYQAKGDVSREVEVADPGACAVLRSLKALGTEGELLRYRRAKGGWDDVRSEDINDYLRELVGCEVTAKDFRTWHATVLAAVGLAVSRHAPASGAARKRAVTRVMREVAEYLGNTPTVARASYVDPRVVEAYDQDRTIGAVLTELGADADYGQLATHGTVERAVIDLIRAV